MAALLAIFASLSTIVMAIEGCPAICVSDPLLRLDAGISNVSATIDNVLERQCVATLHFENASFLPVTYHFDAVSCKGLELASFTVPLEAPNGPACIVWRCASQETLACSNVIVSGGRSNPSMATNRGGTMGCLSESVETHTTLVTVTLPSTTFTTLSTSFLTTHTTHTPLPVARQTTSPPSTWTDPSFTTTTPGSAESGPKIATGATQTRTDRGGPAGEEQARTITSQTTPSQTTPSQATQVPTTQTQKTEPTTPQAVPPGSTTPTDSGSTTAAISTTTVVATSIVSTVTLMQTVTSTVPGTCASETGV